MTAGAVAGVIALSGGEEFFWAWRAEPSDLRPLLLATGLMAGAAALLALVLHLRLPRGPALATALSLAAVRPILMAGENSLGYGLRHHPIRILLTVVVGCTLGWVTQRIRGALALACAGLLAFGTAPAVRGMVLGERPPEAFTPPDVILVVMDTTRRDHLSLYGYPRSTTPHLDAFAREAEVFEDAWSVSSRTPPSHASMFTGLLPAQHGVDGEEGPPFVTAAMTLASVFRSHGYRTGGFPANPHLDRPGWSRGFDDYRPPWRSAPHSLLPLAARGDATASHYWPIKSSSHLLLSRARRWWLDHRDQPRFLFVNLLDPHRPYDPPLRFFKRFLENVSDREAKAVSQDPIGYHIQPGISPTDARILRGLYDAELAALDDELGAFLDWLRARGDLDDAIVVITSDHGERLGERGLVGHELSPDPYLLRVPLLVRHPRGATAGREKRRVQLDGLPGYVLHLAGLSAPPAMEASALDRHDRSVVVAQLQSQTWFVSALARRHPGLDPRPYLGDWSFACDGRFAYLRRSQGTAPPAEILNDMELDPDWTRDDSASHPQELARLRAAATALPPFGVASRAPIDDETRNRLRALGYLE